MSRIQKRKVYLSSHGLIASFFNMINLFFLFNICVWDWLIYLSRGLYIYSFQYCFFLPIYMWISTFLKSITQFVVSSCVTSFAVCRSSYTCCSFSHRCLDNYTSLFSVIVFYNIYLSRFFLPIWNVLIHSGDDKLYVRRSSLGNSQSTFLKQYSKKNDQVLSVLVMTSFKFAVPLWAILNRFTWNNMAVQIDRYM